jgi:hypothetical protein
MVIKLRRISKEGACSTTYWWENLVGSSTLLRTAKATLIILKLILKEVGIPCRLWVHIFLKALQALWALASSVS